MLSEKPWKPEAVLRLLLGLCVCLTFSSLLLHVALPAGALETGPGKFLTLLISTIGFHWLGLLLAAAFLREHQTGWADAFGFNAPRAWLAALLGAAGAVAILPVAWVLGHWSAKVIIFFSHQPPARQAAVQAVESAVGLDQQAYTLVATLLLAPFVEEVLFRGILYPSVKQLGYPRLALWGTSLFFGFIHSNLMTFVPLTVLSLLLVWLYERTGNLLAPILTHCLFNTANYVLLLHERDARALLESFR